MVWDHEVAGSNPVAPICHRGNVMALTFIEGVVHGKRKKSATVEFLVDSGAVYTLLPEKDWKAIGLKPKRKMTFTLADGTKVERSISECHISLPQGEGHTPVILGEPGDEPLLGAVTLEILGLVLNPFRRSLEPMRAMLA
jgi:clan AA aspartic protease